jgi:chromosome segregation ATPase
MKRFFLALFFVSIFLFSSTSPLLAGDNTDSTREQIIKERQQLQQNLKDKFATIKNTHKKALAEKIDQKMTNLNQRRTEQMTEHLQKLAAILNRLKNKAPDLQEIVDAEKAITTAQAAITAQAAKTYTAQITTETNLRANLGTQVKALETDLKSVRQLVQTAHQTVIAALQAVKKLGGSRGQPTLTPAATTGN